MYENYSVLFVDDEVNILNSIRRGLIDEVFTAYYASSGEEALEIMESVNIAVLVTDMRMPEMDGLRLLKLVKLKWPKTVGIILSGYTQLQQIIATINQVDIFKFITKPWKMEDDFKIILYQALDYYILQVENEEYKIALKNKNDAYQNILKSIEPIIENAKQSCHILEILGISILTYNKHGKKNFSEEFSEYHIIIYENFANALPGEKKEYGSEQFEKDYSQFICSKIDVSRNENDLDPTLEFTANSGIIEATLMSCITIFQKEFQAKGLLLKYGMVQNKYVTISMSCMQVSGDIKIDELKLLNEKVHYINSILHQVLKHCKMDFSVIYKNDKIAIFILIPIYQKALAITAPKED